MPTPTPPTFIIPYRNVYQLKSTWQTIVHPLGGGVEHRISVWDIPQVNLSIEMQKSLGIIIDIKTFFNACK
jgi:hypothetical protein